MTAPARPRWPNALLFDLDGTLVDTVPGIARSLDATLAAAGLPLRGEAAARDWVGNGVPRLVERAICGALDGDADPDLTARLVADFLVRYERDSLEHSRPYPGAMEALDDARRRGIGIACVTNKPQRPAERLLAHLGIDRHLDLIVGGSKELRAKPDPEPLLVAMRGLGATCAQAVLIGDSTNDVLAARAAGTAVIAVSYGYNHGRDIREACPDTVIASLADLSDALDALAVGRGLPDVATR